jgi:DNA-binding transcriptional ArsR family regulator
MSTVASFAEVAAVAGDPARANMLMTLMDGRAFTAGELARVAGITPQTASSHLARLIAAGLLTVYRQGRHHYHCLASPAVAHMVESIMEVSASRDAARRPVLVTGPRDPAMREARTCFDHLAGRLAVRLADAMSEKGYVELSAEGGAVTPAGLKFFDAFGIALERKRSGAHVFCRPCLDWSERRLHIGGAVGAALAARCLEIGWVRRREASRALTVTRPGEQGFRKTFGI